MTIAFGEADQIRVPMPDGSYRDYSILHLLGANHSQLRSIEGAGMPPIRIIEQSGPLQQGSTLVNYRYNNRVLQIVISERLTCVTTLRDRRFDLVDLLRPSRSFPTSGGQPKPLIYRKWLPGGDTIRGLDLELTAGSAQVTALRGRFVHYGLRVGSRFTISGSTGDDGDYTVTAVTNDGSITLSSNMTNTETGVHYQYQSEPSVRDLFCICEIGPQFDRGDENQRGYTEALRFVANDPFWYGASQEASFAISDSFDNLVFDIGEPGVADADAGAWFGDVPGSGRWIFSGDYVSKQIEIPYWGHEFAAPIITITGPANDPIIRNTDLASQLSFDYNVVAGQVVTIDTLNLTVTDNAGQDLYSFLTGDVSGFLITPDARNDRVNTLEVNFGDADSASEVEITWQNRYDTI